MDRIIDDAVRKPSGEKDGETGLFPLRGLSSLIQQASMLDDAPLLAALGDER
jgi:hypothetical protein